MKKRTYIIFFSLVFALSSAYAATIVIPSKQQTRLPDVPQDLPEVAPLPWPSEPRPIGNAQGFTRQFDGFKEILIRFSLPTFDCIIEPFGIWKAIPQGERYSILLKSADSSVTFGVSQFRKGEFLTSLKDEDWVRYTHFLKTANPHLQIKFETSNLDSNDGLYVLGEKYREIVYETVIPKKEPILVQEIFAFVNDQLTVFTVKGKKSDVLRKKGATHAMICRMNYPEEES
ncbi:hypothetical protein MLD52_08420 [Puniceicoccaceae bacterium K14]|nr:hypothetical protein [Puniceicoccaceae bacterium K14]